MKISYTLAAIAAIGIIFVALNPMTVSAESNPTYLAEQPQINALVTIAIPPYKW